MFCSTRILRLVRIPKRPSVFEKLVLGVAIRCSQPLRAKPLPMPNRRFAVVTGEVLSCRVGRGICAPLSAAEALLNVRSANAERARCGGARVGRQRCYYPLCTCRPTEQPVPFGVPTQGAEARSRPAQRHSHLAVRVPARRC